MKPESAPKPGCPCAVCDWANRRIEREQRQAADLAENYARYEAGLLVSKGDDE